MKFFPVEESCNNVCSLASLGNVVCLLQLSKARKHLGSWRVGRGQGWSCQPSGAPWSDSREVPRGSPPPFSLSFVMAKDRFGRVLGFIKGSYILAVPVLEACRCLKSWLGQMPPTRIVELFGWPLLQLM